MSRISAKISQFTR